MPILASAGSAYEPPPAGLHLAVCIDVVDMGQIEVTWQGKTTKRHKVRVVWQIDALRDDGTPFYIQKRYTLSLHEKANLRGDLESWRGKAFTQDELQGFDLEKLIGVNCQLNTQHVSKDGTVYANVSGVVPLAKGQEKLVAAAYIRVKDRREPEEEVVDDEDIPF